MESQSKLQRLGALDEAALRERVLVPLLGRMGLRAPMVNHGPHEHGKDILCYDIDRLGHRVYHAVVAKVGDLTGSTSSNRSLRDVLYQVEQCFNVPHHDVFGMRAVTMDSVWVVTTGRILPSAAASVLDLLQKSNLAKITRLIDVTQLASLIDEHYPSYWREQADTLGKVTEQRDTALQFVQQLLARLGGSREDIDLILTSLQHSATLPRIENLRESQLFYASPYKVELATVSCASIASLPNSVCDSIVDLFLEAKRELRMAVLDTLEMLDIVEDLLKSDDPRTFAAKASGDLMHQDPFCRPYNSCGDFIGSLGSLEQAIAETDELRVRLERKDLLAWAEEVNNAISSCGLEVESHLRDMPDSQELHVRWIVDAGPPLRVRFMPGRTDGSEIGVALTTTTRTRVTTYGRSGSSERGLVAADLLSAARSALRTYLDSACPPPEA